ncbi:hypothetical protein I4U23_008892 [Adineta vaga]|nr:hypothetical protein I4U23_008892 [Adineta vaga]
MNNENTSKENSPSQHTCYKQLSTKQKLVFKLIVIALLFVSIVSIIILPPVVLLVIRRTTLPTSTATVNPCSSTTCIGQETPNQIVTTTVLYQFNGNANDSSGRFVGIPFGNPTYVTQSCVGTSALNLNSGSFQYIQIPYVNLEKQSFTIETWLYLTTNSVVGDFGIFSQCDLDLICLSISLKNGRFILSFDSMNIQNKTLVGTTLFSIREWMHLTVIYDATLYQQRIYINGRIDAVSNGIVSAYQGASKNTTTTVGRSRFLSSGFTFFQGRIDHFKISIGTVRTTCQIYNDATLTAYYPFDTSSTFDDFSVNRFNGIASNTTVISAGRYEQAINFTSSISYFQAQSFPVIRNTSGSSPPFTFSLWVNPTSPIGGGSLVHISNLPSGAGFLCYDLLALTMTGALVVQFMESGFSVTGLQGPILPINTWSHIAVIYSRENGIRLLFNGQVYVTSSLIAIPQNIARWEVPLYITLGNNSPLGPSSGITCQTGSISFVSGSYIGAIDEFRLYNRELNAQELCNLVNI